MEPHQLAAIEELPNYLAAEGIVAELRYRESGGMGPWPPIETITMFIGTNVAAGLIAGAAWASMTGAVKWARERIRRDPPHQPEPDEFDPDPDADKRPTVVVELYGPRGELLSQVAVNRDEVRTLFGEPIADPDATA